ncbi:MAG: hypothetical protein Q9200_004682 [Gallowayella weberi]
MPPSQLKRLKTSLREQGITGQQKSKKQKKNTKTSKAFRDSQIQRHAALEGIREQFNPFEIRAPTRPSKHDVATNKVVAGKVINGAIARPGVTKGFGEENRRNTLLKGMQRRNKVGGILDRRFGEDNPKMTPEERALERFVKEKQRGSKNDTLFDLEDAGEDDQLTHFGQSLSFDKSSKTEDFQEEGFSSEGESDNMEVLERPNKRRRISEDVSYKDEEMIDKSDGRPARPKTKKEVMNEVIAKSKLHKYERQQAKEDDDDLRAQLDKGLPDLLSFMRGAPQQSLPSEAKPAPNGNMNPDRAAMLDGKDRGKAEKEYDERLREMTFDQRSKPTEPTLTEVEKLEVEAQRLQDLEQQRLFRMKGEQISDDEEDKGSPNEGSVPDQDEQDAFGLGPGLAQHTATRQLDVEDEDDFVIEDNLTASHSEPESLQESSQDGSENENPAEEDDEFVKGLFSEHDVGFKEANGKEGRVFAASMSGKSQGLAYTYECPQSHEELLKITQGVPIDDQPTMVQRIRALYHPKLQAGNKAKLEVFSTTLVDHVSYLVNNTQNPSFAGLEALIRHIHSLAKMFPEVTSRAFRAQLKSLVEDRPLGPTPGDLIILTAIGTTFPTSDHFHQVVTPAMLYMGMYLDQKIPQSLNDLATGIYLCSLCLQYQRLSRRYVPELLNYILNALCALSDVQPRRVTSFFPLHSLPDSFRLTGQSDGEPRKLKFWDVVPMENASGDAEEELKLALLSTIITMCSTMADLWNGKSAFGEIFEPVTFILTHLTSKVCASNIGKPTRAKAQEALQQIKGLVQEARVARKPLLLHNHRPLPIKTSIPKFEESFNPDKHYDPDRDRAEMNKLKAEYKKERKGALRELRKDANFTAREHLKEKKEKDAQYEKKFKRLVAEIQGEEGREAKIYEREKRMRKGKR